MTTSVVDEFKEQVRLGRVLDRYGNRFCIYSPAQDTFFSCLSYAQCGSDSLRGIIRHKLMASFLERVLGHQCNDAEEWRGHNDAESFRVSETAANDHAVRSLAATCSGIVGDNAALVAYIVEADQFRQDVIQFIDSNLRDGVVYCRYAFAYLYCSMYDSDVVFYREQHGDVSIETEISKVNGRATQVMYKRTYEKGRGNRINDAPTPRVHHHQNEDDSSVSDSDSSNWHSTYLLYIRSREGNGRFELLYTPTVGDDAEQQTRRRQRYQLRVCYVDGQRGRMNSEPREGHPANLTPPPRGWKVHSYLLAPDELFPERIYQVNSAQARGLAACRLPENKTLFVYLYYKDVGGQPMAIFVNAIAGGLAPEPPMFLIRDDEQGNADGVLVTLARQRSQANKHIQLELHAKVEVPGE